MARGPALRWPEQSTPYQTAGAIGRSHEPQQPAFTLVWGRVCPGFLILGGFLSVFVGGSLWEAKESAPPAESAGLFGFAPKTPNAEAPAFGFAPTASPPPEAPPEEEKAEEGELRFR